MVEWVITGEELEVVVKALGFGVVEKLCFEF
jgi:hypothetical protein